MDHAPDASERIVDDRAMRRFAAFDSPSGLQGIAPPPPHALQPRSRSARARFAAPSPGAGRVPDSIGIHHAKRGEDDAVRAL